MSTSTPNPTRPVRYRVTLRSGLARDYTSKRDALDAAAAERRDGWPSQVTDLSTGETLAPPPALRWTRTDRTDGASEVLSLVSIEGESWYADCLGQETPYLVQVTTGPDAGDDFVGLFDLDGARVDVGNADWSLVHDAPAEVVSEIENGWETGTSFVERLR